MDTHIMDGGIRMSKTENPDRFYRYVGNLMTEVARLNKRVARQKAMLKELRQERKEWVAWRTFAEAGCVPQYEWWEKDTYCLGWSRLIVKIPPIGAAVLLLDGNEICTGRLHDIAEKVATTIADQ